MPTAAELLREFEGFRATPYWDRTALRAGFGSDTVTLEDGTVVRVTDGTRVTREDAERDLARRIPEFVDRGIIPYVGADNWARLPEDTKAALISLAYNYGSLQGLPTLARAIREGDTDAIADAVAARAVDNDGVNAARRRREAEIIRGAPLPAVGLPDEVVPATSYNLADLRRRNAIGTAPRVRTPSAELQARRANGGNLPLPAPAPLDLPIDRPRTAPPASIRTGMLGSPIADGTGFNPSIEVAEYAAKNGLDMLPAGIDFEGNNTPRAIMAGGTGSLFDPRLTPSMPNPVPRTTTVAGRPTVPVSGLPAAPRQTTVAGRPDVPVGSMPAARPAQTVSSPSWQEQFDAAIRSGSTNANTEIVRRDGTVVPVPRAGSTAMPPNAVPEFIRVANPALNKTVAPGAGVSQDMMKMMRVTPAELAAMAKPSTPIPATILVKNPDYIPIPAPITQRPVMVPAGTPVRAVPKPVPKKTGTNAADRQQAARNQHNATLLGGVARSLV